MIVEGGPKLSTKEAGGRKTRVEKVQNKTGTQAKQEP